MLIEQKEENGSGMFFIGMDDAPLAELIYTIDDKGNLIIEHTEVDKSLAGKNVGTELVYNAAEYARERNLRLLPKCSFAKSVLENMKK